MYTRAYPQSRTPLPQNYSGVALREATEDETPKTEVEETPTPPSEAPEAKTYAPPCEDPPRVVHTAPQEETESDGASVTSEEKEACPTVAPLREERREDTKENGAAEFPTADLLLIALAVLLMQGERQDNELLMALLFLLLYN